MDQKTLRRLLAPRYIRSEMLRCHAQIHEMLTESPEIAQVVSWPPDSDFSRPYYAADYLAESTFEYALRRKFDEHVTVLWANSVSSDTDVSGKMTPCILIDILDGAHLWHRGLPLWCSAIVTFDPRPPTPQILESYVGMPALGVFFFANASGAFKVELSNGCLPETRVEIQRSAARTLREATVCMYAQRAAHLLPLFDPKYYGPLQRWLAQVDEADAKLRGARQEYVHFRFYSFAGNPVC